MRRFLISLFALGIGLTMQAQQLNPSDYIYPLLGVDGLYAGNFGEIRGAHFHAGADIKTNNVEGKPVVAVADGYVSRLSVSTYGYGRALYVTLNNGTTAVYGHLQRFRPDIEKYVQKERHRKQSNSVNLWFNSKTWPVKQGDVIAYSGNTGSSGGPHLHYEVRDTPTQRVYNLVSQGVIRPKDNIPPQIYKVYYIPTDTLEGVPMHARPVGYTATKVAAGEYRIKDNASVKAGRKGFLVIEATDRRNGTNNTYGLWRVEASVDGVPYFEYRIDSFTFDQTHYSNVVSYYPLQSKSGHEMIQLAQTEQAPGDFYPLMVGRGLIRTTEGQKRNIEVELYDDCGNRSHVAFTLEGGADSPTPQKAPEAIAVRADEGLWFSRGSDLEVNIPAGALYETTFCAPDCMDIPVRDSTVVILTSAWQVLPITTPLAKSIDVAIAGIIPKELRPYCALAARNEKHKLEYVGGKYVKGMVRASTTTTGPLYIVADTIPPHATPMFTVDSNLAKTDRLLFKIGDNFSGISSCTLTLDGQWVPCDRLPMQGKLYYTFEQEPDGATHSAQLQLTDGCGNLFDEKYTFTR